MGRERPPGGRPSAAAPAAGGGGGGGRKRRRGARRAGSSQSSSSMDSEARRQQVARRARRRKEHEDRERLARVKAEQEKEGIKLALMTEDERKKYLRDKEQKELNDMVQERKIKVQRLQLFKAKVAEKLGKGPASHPEPAGRKWSLDEESSVDGSDGLPAGGGGPGGKGAEEEVDPLDAFMSGISDQLGPLRIKGVNDGVKTTIGADEIRTMRWRERQERARGAAGGEDEEEDETQTQEFIAALKKVDAEADPEVQKREEEERERAEKKEELVLAELTEKTKEREKMEIDFDKKEFGDMAYRKEKPEEKIKDLKEVDHSKMHYEPFRKDFYVPCAAMKAMGPDQIKQRRVELDKIKIKGEELAGMALPAPIEKWEQGGLSDTTLKTLADANFELPFPIQAQGLPIIMSGRDMIGCARTGAGKTLAYLLPMLRHIIDQPGLLEGDGPIAFILVPTRELAQQIWKEGNKFSKALGIHIMACYGGVPIADQIAEARRGVHTIIGTPGRMIDLMVANKGRVVPTNRATFCVLDEADRMLDLGFGPQIAKIVNNIRPDRQTVMFSATMPKQIEVAAKKFMSRPVQVIIGGRRNPSSNVTQHVDCFELDEHRFERLLQLLGEWYDKGLVLIFTETQSDVDSLWEDLFAHGYDKHCITLHAGMEQVDRDLALFDFNTGEGGKRILIATSIASRGIDVPDIELVINYKCPSHTEEYIHRVGRTGRANKRGVAWTFYLIGMDECHASWLVKALQDSNNEVPETLQQIANEFWTKRKNGLIPYFRPNQGYGQGKKTGYKFDERESRFKREERKRQMRAHGLIDDSDDEKGRFGASSDDEYVKVNVDKQRVTNVTDAGSGALVMHPSQNISKAQQYAIALSQQIREKEEMAAQNKFTTEVEINDYPQSARWKVTNREMCGSIIERFEATVMVKGLFCSKGNPPPGERKLYLQIDGKEESQVMGAKKAIQELLEEETQKLVASSSSLGVGRPLRSDGRAGQIGGPRF